MKNNGWEQLPLEPNFLKICGVRRSRHGNRSIEVLKPDSCEARRSRNLGLGGASLVFARQVPPVFISSLGQFKSRRSDHRLKFAKVREKVPQILF